MGPIRQHSPNERIGELECAWGKVDSLNRGPSPQHLHREDTRTTTDIDYRHILPDVARDEFHSEPVALGHESCLDGHDGAAVDSAQPAGRIELLIGMGQVQVELPPFPDVAVPVLLKSRLGAHPRLASNSESPARTKS